MPGPAGKYSVADELAEVLLRRRVLTHTPAKGPRDARRAASGPERLTLIDGQDPRSTEICLLHVRSRTEATLGTNDNARSLAGGHSMKTENEVKVKYGVWGLILGAGAAMIIGFTWGGWTTRGTSVAATDAAVLTTRVAICVAQFAKAPNEQQRLKELKAINTWERAAYIEKGGWDRMPGEEKASDTVARPCADGLGVLMEKST